jgi:hypothetical protein
VRTIAFFAHDWTESTVAKRVAAFQAQGSRVKGFMFRRAHRVPVRGPIWENVELGTTVDRHYLRRVPMLLVGTIRLLQHRKALKSCRIYYARNIDMLFIAIVAKAIAQSKAPIVYEVLDIQRIFAGLGLANRVFRWVERWLMARSALLVVSSPDFISEYFRPRQHYSGQWRLLENKVFPIKADWLQSNTRRRIPVGPPWVIGWFGTLRCARSLKTLCRIADVNPDLVTVHIRGLPSHEDLPINVIEAACAERTNMLYGGSYRSPEDLATIYGVIHFAWCIDYLDAGGNSDWLLPNRVYEGCLMGAMCLARKNTATSRMVEGRGLGWAFEEPAGTSVSEFLAHLKADEYLRMQRRVEAENRARFADLTDTRDLLHDMDELVKRSLVTVGNPR